MEDHIKSVLKTQGLPSRIIEMIIGYLRCHDYEKRSASYLINAVPRGLTSSARIDYLFNRECDCLSDFTILDSLNEIDRPPELEIGSQVIGRFTKTTPDTWKLTEVFCAPNPPLPILSLGWHEVRLVIERRSQINVNSKIKVIVRGTILNQHRRLLHFSNTIDGFSETWNLRWRTKYSMFGLRAGP